VGEADVAQARERQHLADRLGDQREHAARAGVEEERRLVRDQVLVEAEGAAGKHGRGVDAVDARGDLVEVGAAGCVGDHGEAPFGKG